VKLLCGVVVRCDEPRSRSALLFNTSSSVLPLEPAWHERALFLSAAGGQGTSPAFPRPSSVVINKRPVVSVRHDVRRSVVRTGRRAAERQRNVSHGCLRLLQGRERRLHRDVIGAEQWTYWQIGMQGKDRVRTARFFCFCTGAARRAHTQPGIGIGALREAR